MAADDDARGHRRPGDAGRVADHGVLLQELRAATMSILDEAQAGEVALPVDV